MAVESPPDLFELLISAIKEGIEEYTIELITNAKPEGFFGDILFVNLTHKVTKEEKRLLVKQGKVHNGIVDESLNNFFLNEIVFYGTIWPFMQQYYKNASGKELNFVPECYSTSDEGRMRIILQNIKQEGYELRDKSKPFDDDHFELIFKTYGIYHAVSMAIREQDSDKYNSFVEQLYEIDKKSHEDESFQEYIIECFRNAQEYFDAVEEKAVLDKLRSCEKSGLARIMECTYAKYTNGVLLHADCWSNNMMFKYDENRRVQEIKLLDFQVVRHGSPVFDLSHCLYCGGCGENFSKLEEYLKVYYSSLSHTLKEFNLDPETVYPFETLKEEWKRFCIYIFPSSLCLWGIKLGGNNETEYENRVREFVLHMYDNDFL